MRGARGQRKFRIIERDEGGPGFGVLRDGNRFFQRAGDEEDISRAGLLVFVGRGGDGDCAVACARSGREGDPRRVALGGPRPISRNGQRLIFAVKGKRECGGRYRERGRKSFLRHRDGNRRGGAAAVFKHEIEHGRACRGNAVRIFSLHRQRRVRAFGDDRYAVAACKLEPRLRCGGDGSLPLLIALHLDLLRAAGSPGHRRGVGQGGGQDGRRLLNIEILPHVLRFVGIDHALGHVQRNVRECDVVKDIRLDVGDRSGILPRYGEVRQRLARGKSLLSNLGDALREGDACHLPEFT